MFQARLAAFLLFAKLTPERALASRGGEEREGDRIPSRLHAASAEPEAGLELMNCEIMTWAATNGQMLNRLSQPGAPPLRILYYVFQVGLELFRCLHTPGDRWPLHPSAQVCTLLLQRCGFFTFAFPSSLGELGLRQFIFSRIQEQCFLSPSDIWVDLSWLYICNANVTK